MADSPKPVKTRLCLISDTHTHPPLPLTDTTHPYRLPLPSSDILLHAGDITMAGRLAEYETMLQVLKSADAELKIVIAGNHDITLDEEYYGEFGEVRHGGRREDLERVRELWCGEEARRVGVVYLEEGVRTFVLRSGARFTVCVCTGVFYDATGLWVQGVGRFLRCSFVAESVNLKARYQIYTCHRGVYDPCSLLLLPSPLEASCRTFDIALIRAPRHRHSQILT